MYASPLKLDSPSQLNAGPLNGRQHVWSDMPGRNADEIRPLRKRCGGGDRLRHREIVKLSHFNHQERKDELPKFGGIVTGQREPGEHASKFADRSLRISRSSVGIFELARRAESVARHGRIVRSVAPYGELVCGRAGCAEAAQLSRD